MSTVKVNKLSITEKKIKENDELKKIFATMTKHGIKDPIKLLPQTPWHNVSFVLSNTYSGFANGIRRAIMEELPVNCLSFDNKKCDTNDEFILLDIITKNINLIPINQEEKLSDITPLIIKGSLNVDNKSNDIINVKSSDIKIANYDLILEPNIIITALRPGKHIKISEFIIERGYCMDNAAKFSLANNVTYYPLDVEPYDVIKKTGVRSISYDPTEFYLSFKTTGNIKPKTLISLLHDELTRRLTKCAEHIKLYQKERTGNIYYTADMTVDIVDDMYTYKFIGEYITLAYMIGQRCYMLDKNIAYCGPTVDRYDTRIAIIRLKHADANKLLLQAVNACIADIDVIKRAF